MKKQIIILLLLWFSVNVYCQTEACKLINDMPRSVKRIKDSAFKIVHASSDDCIVEFMDSLRKRFIKTHKTEYLICLDSICWNCNDRVGENFIDTTLFYQSFKPYIDYLYKNGDTANCLAVNLISGFGFDIMDDPNDVYDAKKRLENFIAKQEREYKFSEGEKRFIDVIKREAEFYDMEEKE
jgi:hypothetical protein